MAESTENSASIASTSSSILNSSSTNTAINDDGNKLRARQEQTDEESDAEMGKLLKIVLFLQRNKTLIPNIVKLECPVCLQTCIHPARLPCGHIFCFLCVKVCFKNDGTFQKTSLLIQNFHLYCRVLRSRIVDVQCVVGIFLQVILNTLS